MVSKQEDTMASVTIGECTIEVFISIIIIVPAMNASIYAQLPSV